MKQTLQSQTTSAQAELGVPVLRDCYTDKLIYHYTNGQTLVKILNDGQLRVSEFERRHKVKPPALWFSRNENWEVTATKMVLEQNGELISLTKDELHTMVGLYRFVVPFIKSNFCSWGKYKYKSNTLSAVYEAMEQAGREQGANPDEWFAVFKNVPLNDCLRCEKWDGEKWETYIDPD